MLGPRNTHGSLDQACWQSDSIVALRLRKYPGSHLPPQLTVIVDCVASRGNVSGKTVLAEEIEATLARELIWPALAPEEATGFSGRLQRLHRMWIEKFYPQKNRDARIMFLNR